MAPTEDTLNVPTDTEILGTEGESGMDTRLVIESGNEETRGLDTMIELENQ